MKKVGVKDKVDEGNTTTVLNEEIMPTVRELRTKANLELREESSITTAGDAAYTEIWRSPVLETTGAYGLWADVKWSNADSSVWARIKISNSVASSLGTVALVMVDFGEIHYTTIGLDARWQVDSVNRQAYLQIKDDGVNAMTGKAVVTMSAREV